IWMAYLKLQPPLPAKQGSRRRLGGSTPKPRRKGLKRLIPDALAAPEGAGVSRASRLHPLAVGLRRLDRGLDEGEALDPVVDGREVGGPDRLFARPRGFDGERDLGIDGGETLEIAFGMPRGHARHPRRRFPRVRPAAGDDPGRSSERRPVEVIWVVLPPVEAALRPVDSQHEAVLVARRDLA